MVVLMRTSLSAPKTIVKKSCFVSANIGTDALPMDRLSKPGAATKRCGDPARRKPGLKSLAWVFVVSCSLAGCGHVIPIAGTFRGEGSASVTADANVRGAFEVKMPASVDPGNMTCTVVRPGHSAAPSARIALVDIDGVQIGRAHV